MPVLLVSLWGYPDPLNPAGAPQLAPDGASVAQADEAGMQPPGAASAESAVAAAAAILAGDSGADGPSLCPTELSAYLDAEAAYAYLAQDRRLAADCILVHGVSIGGAIGSSLALNHPGVRLTLDQPFCSLGEVTRHMTHGVVDGVISRQLQARGWLRAMKVARVCLTPAVSRAVAYLLVRMCFKKGLGGKAAGCAPTDLLDTVGKARRIEGELFVFYAASDEMMHPDAPLRIVGARYRLRARADAEAELRRRGAAMDGGHMAFFGEHSEACGAYVRYLAETGFLAPARAGAAEGGAGEAAGTEGLETERLV